MKVQLYLYRLLEGKDCFYHTSPNTVKIFFQNLAWAI